MLKELLQIFTTNKPAKSIKKHLSLQTHYVKTTDKAPLPPVKAEIKPVMLKPVPKKIVPKLTLEQLIAKQKQFLKSHPDFQDTKIEQCHLEKSTRFVSFVKHKLWCQGMLVYPESIRYSRKWEELKQVAEQNQTSLGIFATDMAIPSLKITNNQGDIQFLIPKVHLRLINSRTPVTQKKDLPN